MKPRSGLAQPSLSTCTHSRSTRFSMILTGTVSASRFITRRFDSSTTRSMSFPPSGSIRAAFTARQRREKTPPRRRETGLEAWRETRWLVSGDDRKGEPEKTMAAEEAIEGSCLVVVSLTSTLINQKSCNN